MSVLSRLTAPWLAPMLREVVLCRAVVVTVAVLGFGHLLGYSLWPCVFANVTGLPCPGCGMTRAASALLHGEWREAMAFHPFAPGVLLFGALVVFSAMAPSPWRNTMIHVVEKLETTTRLPTIFLLAAAIYGLLRMGGICSNHATVKPSPVRTWLQERRSDGR